MTRPALVRLILVSSFLAVATPADFARAQIPIVTTSASASTFVPDRLRCEYRIDPLGIDSAMPRLDWIGKAGNPVTRGLSQTAYQILAASSPDVLGKDVGDLWDSGKIASSQMSQIAYAGKPLVSNQPCWWKVRVWDQSGNASVWSPVAQWTMGVLNDADWDGAKWIGAPNGGTRPDLKGPLAEYETVLLRREFTVKSGLKRAVANVCGLGQYEMTIDGVKVGNDLLTPDWTQYNKTCLYDTYNLAASLPAGPHAVGLFLGNGMFLLHKGRFSSNTNMTNNYGPVQVIASIRLEYADGSSETVITNDQWHCASGPITFSSGYGGEDYDARLVPQAWDHPGFIDSSWDKPQELKGPGGALKGLSSAGPPIHAFESLTPISQKRIKPGTTVYDLGQNAALMLRLKVSGSAGSIVRVSPGELAQKDGTVNTVIFGHKPVWWQYTLKGSGDESYLSKFFYVGGRYLQVELTPGAGSSELPKVESIEGMVVHSDTPAVGEFSCSNDLFNRTFALVRWAQQNNMVSIMTDCPTREKRGWLEEDHLNGPALRYNWEMAPLFVKVANDMKDAQRPDGLVPSTCPDYMHRHDGFADSPEWGSACILVPWQQYDFDGDTDLLGRSYDTMQKYQAYVCKKANKNIVSYGLGDWFDIGPHSLGNSQLTPLALTATAFYYEDTFLLSKIAEILGKVEDATRYAQQADKIRAAFQQALFHADTNQYGAGIKIGSQAGNSIALVMDLTDAASRSAVLDNIVKDVKEKGLTAGDIGYRYLLRALADGGRSDVIYTLNNQSDKPGYGYQLKQGKTSLTEGWDGSASQDHFMLGQINEWFYHDLAGIQDDLAGPGFKKIVIKPAVVGGLTWVKASYDSICGKIVSEWNRDGQTVTLHVVIPVNTSGTIWVPSADSTSVREGGRTAESSSGLAFLRMDGFYSLFQAGAGDYTFTATLPAAASN